MRTEERVSWAVLGAGGLYVGGLLLDRTLLPYADTLAITLLAVLVRIRSQPGRPRRLTLVGLVLLAAAAGLDDQILMQLTLFAMGAAVLAAAVLGRVDQLRHLPGPVARLLAGGFVLLVAGLGGIALFPAEDLSTGIVRSVVIIVPAVALVLLALAATATVFAGARIRVAGAGLLPVLALLLSLWPPAMEDDLVQPPPPVAEERHHYLERDIAVRQSELSVDAYHYALDDAYRYPIGPVPAVDGDEPVSGFAGVFAPSIWSGNIWDERTDWRSALPALSAALLLLSLIALTTSLFPRPEPRP